MSARQRRSSIGATVAAFAVLGVASIAAVAVVAGLVLRSVTQNEALREARQVARNTARTSIEPDLTNRVLRGDPAAIARLERAVEARVLRTPVVRVKLWGLDGRILFSDLPGLIGRRFTLSAGALTAARRDHVTAEISDAGAPENVHERGFGRLLEVYVPVRTPDGHRLLWEEYLRYSSVAESGRRQWMALLPAVGGGLLVLALAQLPLAWWLAHRLRAREEEREALLLGAVESSDRERRRMAQALHEGPVQALAGLAWRLSAAARQKPAPSGGDLEAMAGDARDALRDLRSVLVASHPPSLRRGGMGEALADTSARLRAAGVDVALDVDAGASFAPDTEALVFRVAEEALRNVEAHADARHVAVVVRRDNGLARLTVTDDGRGFSPARLSESRLEGHRGLALLEDLAAEAGGHLDVQSSPDGGTQLELEAPAT